MTRMYVDAWDPSYGSSFEGGGEDGPASPSSAQVDTDVEVPAAEWAPIDVPVGRRAPDVVFLVDGVRRNDAGLWTQEEDGASYAGLAASFAAGVVRCDLARGSAELVDATVGRGLFTASPTAQDLQTGMVRYAVHRVSGPGEASKLPAAVQPQLTALEIEISAMARQNADLLVVDGPLRNRRHLPRTLGFVKRQQSQYLSAALNTVVTALRPGQRTPVFHLGTVWGGWSWYLRLPGGSGAPWSGIVRVECSPDLTPEQAIELAELSGATLPRFASSAYKDPRAPQNLVPIAGLERRLRGMLGDARVLHRALTLATARNRAEATGSAPTGRKTNTAKARAYAAVRNRTGSASAQLRWAFPVTGVAEYYSVALVGISVQMDEFDPCKDQHRCAPCRPPHDTGGQLTPRVPEISARALIPAGPHARISGDGESSGRRYQCMRWSRNGSRRAGCA